MDKPSVNTTSGYARAATSAPPGRSLLQNLLSDVATDVEVVTRELGLRNEMLERLRRAPDRMACAQSVLESMGTDCAEAGADGAKAELRIREAVGLLAKEWPREYPAGPVEWQVVAPNVRPTPIALDHLDHVK